MTAASTVAPAGTSRTRPEASRNALIEAAGDTALIAGRNLRKLLRVPRLLIFSTIQPVMLLLLFSFVFGGVAKVPGITYRQFIVPAVLVQTITFAATQTGVGLSTDLQTGMIDRFRSLPIARSAVLVGRSVADTLRLTLQSILLILVAFTIGFRFQNGVAAGALMLVITVAFGLALSTFFAWVGLSVKDPETAQVAGFLPTFPLIFASSAFAPVRTLPGWMQPFAKINPVTAAIDSMRGLAVGGRYATHLGSSLWHLGLAIVVMEVVFTALSVRQYRAV